MWTLNIIRCDHHGSFIVFTTQSPTRRDCLDVAATFKGDFSAEIINRHDRSERITYVDGRRVYQGGINAGHA